MTITALPPANPTNDDIQLIAAERLLAGHVIAYFDGDHRVDHIAVEDRGPIVDPARHPARLIAVGPDGWELTLMPSQAVPVRTPTEPYVLDVFWATHPTEPQRRVRFVAETEEMTGPTARRQLDLLGAGWGDIYSATGGYVDTVVVSWR